jgi:hypothetical protein
MPARNPLAPFLEPLERLGLPYCVTGSVAASVYGELRLTADIYLAARDPLHAWALEHRRRISLEGAEAWIAPPEYVVLRKLEFLREGGQDKHVRDIRFIRAATELDLTFMASEVARLGLNDQWRQCNPES